MRAELCGPDKHIRTVEGTMLLSTRPPHKAPFKLFIGVTEDGQERQATVEFTRAETERLMNFLAGRML